MFIWLLTLVLKDRQQRRGVQVRAPGLTGGVAVDVRPPRVVHASAGRRLTKLKRTIQSSSAVSETQSSPAFYSQLTRWFWLKLVSLDRTTRVLQLWLQDQSLTWSGFQTTKLPITLGRNCVIQHLWAIFGCVVSFFIKSHQHNFCSLWNSLQLCFRCQRHARSLTPVS